MNQIWLIRILYFLVFSCTASWLPVMADYCKQKGFNGSETATILSITPLLMLFIQPMYGALADRLGIKKMLLISFTGAAISFIGYHFLSGFVFMIFITGMMSIFYNGLQTLLDSLSLKEAAKNPKFSYGTLRAFGALGWSVTGLVIGQVIDRINISSIFYISTITLFISFFVGLLLVSDNTEKQKLETLDFKDVKSIIKLPALIWMLLAVCIVSVASTTIWNYYSMYMKENGASATLVGYGLSFQGLCEIPFFYFSAWIIFKITLRKALMITLLATCIRLLLYSIVHNPIAAIPIEILHGISWSLYWVVCVEVINKLVKSEWMATGQSLLYAAYFGIGQIVGNFWTGFLYDGGMKLSNVFLLNAGIICLSFPIVYLVTRKLKTQGV